MNGNLLWQRRTGPKYSRRRLATLAELTFEVSAKPFASPSDVGGFYGVKSPMKLMRPKSPSASLLILAAK